MAEREKVRCLHLRAGDNPFPTYMPKTYSMFLFAVGNVYSITIFFKCKFYLKCRLVSLLPEGAEAVFEEVHH